MQSRLSNGFALSTLSASFYGVQKSKIRDEWVWLERISRHF